MKLLLRLSNWLQGRGKPARYTPAHRTPAFPKAGNRYR